MATPAVDLTTLNPQSEIALRAGDVTHPQAKVRMAIAYVDTDPAYPDAVGLSVLFREGATLDELAQAGHFNHRRLSYTTIGRLQGELAQEGYELVLYGTPAALLPDHCSLAFTQIGGPVEQTLPDPAAEALIRAATIVDNPYKP